MSELRRCPHCGAVLPPNAPAGLCPECLLRQGLESGDAWQASTVMGAGFLPPHPADLAPLFPHLQILELLGKGGMGAVYKARQPALDRLVALKILPPEVGRDPAFAERFAREARALARLSHQNIVAVYDFGQALPPSAKGGAEVPEPCAGLYYFVMEYVDGANLRQLIQDGRMAPQEALAIVPQICEALQFAHEEGIVHRDVKPENILIDQRGRVKIADFGLAKLLRVQPVDVTLTQANQVMGTWHYMAPEQIEHPTEVDHRADIYSLGVVFYEMLTGQLPLGRFEPPSKRAAVDVRLDQVVLRALEREPERRYQYVSEVKTDLEAIGAGKHPAAVAQADRPLARIADSLNLFRIMTVNFLAAFVGVGVIALCEHPLRSLGLDVDSPLVFFGLAAVVWALLIVLFYAPDIYNALRGRRRETPGEAGAVQRAWLPRTPSALLTAWCVLGLASLFLPWHSVRLIDRSGRRGDIPGLLLGFNTWQAWLTAGASLLLLLALVLSPGRGAGGRWRFVGALAGGSAVLAACIGFFLAPMPEKHLAPTWESAVRFWYGEAVVREYDVQIAPHLGPFAALLIGVGLLVIGALGIRATGPEAATGGAGETPTRPLSKQEREALFGEFIGVAAMLGLLGLVWFGMWITGSSWFLLGLCLPWLVPGVAAALDKRDETSELVPWGLGIAVLGTLGLLGYGIWLAKSGWPLLAIAMPFVGIGVAVAVFSDDEEPTQVADKESANSTGEESEGWGWGTIAVVIILVNIVGIPLLGFVWEAVSDLSRVLIDAFDMDQRLQRPLLILLWGALLAGLAYAGYQIWRIFSEQETPGTEGEAAASERLRSRLSRAGFPLLMLGFLIVASLRGQQPQQGAAGPSGEPAAVDARTGALLQAAAGGDATRVRELLSAGVDVNARDPQSGETALMLAAANGHTAVAMTLILLGADVNAQDRRGQTAVMRAAENGRTATLRSLHELRRLSWEPDAAKRQTALRAFPGFDRALIADRNLDLSNLHIEELLRDDDGETASIKAMRAADLECLDLVAATTDGYLARDKRGRNVLMHAAIHGRVELFRALEEDRYFGVAGAMNVFTGRMLLFDLEQSLGVLDGEGMSALQHAEEHGHQEIADILRRHLRAIVDNQTREIEQGGETVPRARRLRGLAHRTLGAHEQAEADLTADR